MKNLRTLWDETAVKYSELPAFRWLVKKDIREKSYGEVNDGVKSVRKMLKDEGFEGSHIALIGKSSPEWMESYLGIVTGVNVAVPLDAGLPDEELIELINRSDSEALFLSPEKEGLKDKVLKECEKIRRIWMMTEEEFASFPEGDESLSSAGEKDVATIIYTSGTTGKSKGVMLTQENLHDNVQNVEYDAEPGCVILSVLPIHHAYCLVMDYLKTMSLGAVICINDSFMHMVRNMGIFKPEVMLMVPLMIETIYKKLSAAEEKALDQPEFAAAKGDSALYEQMLSGLRKTIAGKVFGGNLRIIFSGGAHLDPYYVEKFAEYGVDIYEGYGMSECSPVITSNNPTCHKAGSIGKPLKNVEISFDNGEILVRGSSVMKGYYKMPKETQGALSDGWLHTGDKGYMDEDGYLFINGRVKNLIIMSNGENVSPEEIENKLGLCPLVAEVIVTGENNGLVARIFPDQEAAEKMNLEGDELRAQLQKYIDEYNSSQPSYRHITSLVIRSTPFIRNSTGKIKRQDALKESPAA